MPKMTLELAIRMLPSHLNDCCMHPAVSGAPLGLYEMRRRVKAEGARRLHNARVEGAHMKESDRAILLRELTQIDRWLEATEKGLA